MGEARRRWSAIKAQVVDDVDKRRALYDRFVAFQRFAQSDPWSERVAGKDAHEFAPIADLTSRTRRSDP